MIGSFGNALLLRSELDPHSPVREILAELRRTMLAAWAHQEVSWNDLTVAAGLGILVVTGVVLQRPLQERYWLWRLETGSEAEQLEAVGKLAKIGSAAAIPRLILALESTLIASHCFWLVEESASRFTVYKRVDGVAELIGSIKIECLFGDGTRVLHVDNPIGPSKVSAS